MKHERLLDSILFNVLLTHCYCSCVVSSALCCVGVRCGGCGGCGDSGEGLGTPQDDAWPGVSGAGSRNYREK